MEEEIEGEMKKKTFVTELPPEEVKSQTKNDLDVDYDQFPNRNVALLKDCVIPRWGFKTPQKLPNAHVDETKLIRTVLSKLKINRFPKMVNQLYSSKAIQDFLLDAFWLFFFRRYSDTAEGIFTVHYNKSVNKSKEEVKNYADEIFRRLSVNFTRFTLKMTTKYCSELKDYFMSFLTEFSSKSLYLFYLLSFPKEFLEFQSMGWKKRTVTFFNQQVYGLNNIMHRDRQLILQNEDEWMNGYDVNLNLLLLRLTTKEEFRKQQIAMKIRKIRQKRVCNHLEINEFAWEQELPHPDDYASEEDKILARQQREDDLIAIGPAQSSSSSLSSQSVPIQPNPLQAVNKMKASPSLSLVAEEEAKWSLFVRKVFPKKNHARKLERRLDDLDRRMIMTDEPLEDREAFVEELRRSSSHKHGGGASTGRATGRATARASQSKGNVMGINYTTAKAPRISHVLRTKERKKSVHHHHHHHHHTHNNQTNSGSGSSGGHKDGSKDSEANNVPSFYRRAAARKKKWFETGTGKGGVSKRCKYQSVEKDRRFQAFSKTESPFIRNYLLHLHEEQQRDRIRKIYTERQKTLYSVTNVKALEMIAVKKEEHNMRKKAGKTRRKKMLSQRPKSSYTYFGSRGRTDIPNLLDKESLFTSRPKTTAAELVINKRKKHEQIVRKKKMMRKKRKERETKMVPPIHILKRRNRYRLDDYV